MKTCIQGAMGFLLFFLFAGCQHATTSPAPDPAAPQASGTLAKTTSGDCAPMTVGGAYAPGLSLSGGNYLDVQVLFTAAGNYEIKSDTVNGYSFKGTGQATTTGVATIRLAASGTPIAAGSNVFSIHFNNSICTVAVPVSPAVAAYSFGTSGGACSGVTLGGNYTAGTALAAGNTAQIQVTVTAPGAYSINTDTVNGIYFSKSGNFASTGVQNLVLAGSGTPVAGGSFTYHTARNTGCTFVVVTQAPAATIAQLTTTAVSGTGCSNTTSGGNITSDGGAPVTARGLCYGTAANPTIANTFVSAGTGTGSFSASITGLTQGTTYHVRAFATNAAGTAYGNDISFTTGTSCAVSVYVAGRNDVHNISGDVPNATLWIRTSGTFSNTVMPLSSPGYADANAVFALGTDVYVAGKTNGVATLWKNGTAAQVGATPASSFTSGANAVSVSGTDIYVAGNFQNMPTVWKNNVATTQNNSGSYGDALSVYVSGADVYAAGYAYDFVNGNSVKLAMVWKNGVGTRLTSGPTDAIANSVFVANGDVYVVGQEGTVAKLWKNGVATSLPSNGNKAVANSVFVYGTDVYVVGNEDDGNSPNSYAKLWKNGVGSYLTPTSNYHNWAYSVFVKNGDVYVAGSSGSTSGANTRAMVWINGSATNLTSGSTDAYAYSIFVK